MKTPEQDKDCIASQMAEEYADREGSGNETYEHGLRKGFLAGYNAAMQSTEWQMIVLNNLDELIKEPNEVD